MLDKNDWLDDYALYRETTSYVLMHNNVMLYLQQSFDVMMMLHTAHGYYDKLSRATKLKIRRDRRNNLINYYSTIEI